MSTQRGDAADARIYVGGVLTGFCGGAFGRESYGDKVIEAVGSDWIVVREVDTGEAQFWTGDLDRLREVVE